MFIDVLSALDTNADVFIGSTTEKTSHSCASLLAGALSRRLISGSLGPIPIFPRRQATGLSDGAGIGALSVHRHPGPDGARSVDATALDDRGAREARVELLRQVLHVGVWAAVLRVVVYEPLALDVEVHVGGFLGRVRER